MAECWTGDENRAIDKCQEDWVCMNDIDGLALPSGEIKTWKPCPNFRGVHVESLSSELKTFQPLANNVTLGNTAVD